MSETDIRGFGGPATVTAGDTAIAEPGSERMSINLTVNGQLRAMMVEPRMTLLDALREELALTGTKKGCDRGECGAFRFAGGSLIAACSAELIPCSIDLIPCSAA